jgi:hypothetical protein
MLHARLSQIKARLAGQHIIRGNKQKETIHDDHVPPSFHIERRACGRSSDGPSGNRSGCRGSRFGLARSTYGRDDIEDEQLLRLLWAAGGINRPDEGGRTTPYWQARAVDIYVVRETGVSLYDPENEALTDVLDDDILDVISPQGFVARAPVVLVYVSRQAALVEATDRDRADPSLAIGAHVNTAMMAQNVYLFCAAEGLGTCLVGGADRPAIAEALSLGEDDLVTYVQPVGHAR